MSTTSIRDALEPREKTKWLAFKRFLDQSIDNDRYAVRGDDLPTTMVYTTAEYVQERLKEVQIILQASIDEAAALGTEIGREADVLQQSISKTESFTSDDLLAMDWELVRDYATTTMRECADLAWQNKLLQREIKRREAVDERRRAMEPPIQWPWDVLIR